MINIVIWFIVLLILGIYGASIYTFFKEKEEKEARRK